MEPNFELNPAWDLSSEYASLESDNFKSDLDEVQKNIITLKGLVDSFKKSILETASDGQAKPETIRLVQQILTLNESTGITLRDLRTYVHCQLSVDASLDDCKAMSSRIDKLNGEASEVMTPVWLFLTKASDADLASVLNDPKILPYKFSFEQMRKSKDHLLSETEEALLVKMSSSGFHAWGDLYDSLSGTIKVKIGDETVGLAKAHAMTRSSDEQVRKSAWHAIQQGWTTHAETAASMLNSIAGWRLDELEKRSYKKPAHFLDQPCLDSRIERKTLEAMLSAIESNVGDIREAGFAMAKLMNKKSLDPWDLLAPSPIANESKALSFDQGFQQIKNSFGDVDPSLADFVQMMRDKNWIESRVMPNKTTGAYCTGFTRSKSPRVYMTYMGSSSDVSTLAHELGHAYHSWVMKDMALAECRYPMTLAETASTFAETLLNEALLSQAQSRNQKLAFAWNSASDAMSFLLNIPARFTFEKSFYEARKERSLSVEEIKQLMDQAWTKWYGPVLSENDKMFWAHKLHFYITSVSFYNFPYSFGYLFSLSIYARRKSLGADFMPSYRALLRDTGRMTAEECVMKHLGEDIQDPKFWQNAIDVVKNQVAVFKNLVNAH